MARRNATNVSTSNDAATLDVNHGDSVITNEARNITDVNTSYDVRPDILTTADLDVVEKEEGKIVYDTQSNTHKFWNEAQWVEIGGGIDPNSASGIEFTGGFAGKPLDNQYVWEPGLGINITQDDVDNEIFKTFSMDAAVQAAVDTPYWTDPTPASHLDKGVFGGSYLPEGVSTVFDYSTIDADTYEDGTNVATVGGLDFSQLAVGDKVEIRFDFNAIPQIANTTLQPAIWYKNRDANDNVTFTFPLTAQPIFYGTGTVGKTYLNRIEMSIYIASEEDINSISHFSMKADNPIIIQPLSALFTLVR